MQRTRPYGDYLYHQDREKFEMEFKEWNEAQLYIGHVLRFQQ